MEEITALYITLVVFVVLYPKMKVALAKFAWELERHKRNKPAWGEDVNEQPTINLINSSAEGIIIEFFKNSAFLSK